MKNEPFALILGAGPGLGSAVSHKFKEAGYRVIGIRSRHHDLVDGQYSVDLGDLKATRELLGEIVSENGAPSVVIHNPARLVIKPFLETSEDDYHDLWRSMSLSLFNAMQCVLPDMLAAGGGTVIVSGATASVRGGNRFGAFASAKFALRGLTQSLAREFQSSGIHFTHVLLDGIIDTAASRQLHSLNPKNMLKPDDIAEQYLALINQPKSVWSHELDLRPHTESF